MIRIEGTDKLRRQLERLERETPKVVQSGMVNLGMKVRDELRDHTAQALDFRSSGTRRFIANSWTLQFTKSATAFAMQIYPKGKGWRLLSRHDDGDTVTAADRADITQDGKILIPIAVKRNRRGDVAAGDLPAALLARDAKGRNRAFRLASGTILFRSRLRKNGAQSKRSPVAYVAVDATKNPKRLRVRETVARAVRLFAGAAFAEAIRRDLRRSVGLK